MPSPTGGHSLPSVPKLNERSTALCRLPADPCRIGSACDLAARLPCPARHTELALVAERAGRCGLFGRGKANKANVRRHSRAQEVSHGRLCSVAAGKHHSPCGQAAQGPALSVGSKLNPCHAGKAITNSSVMSRQLHPQAGEGTSRERHRPPYRHQLAMVSAAPARTGRCSLPRPRVMCNKRLGLLTRAVCQTPRGTSTAARPSKERVCRPSGSSSSS